MIDHDTERNPLEVLAGEFAGEHPSVTEYVERHPQWADEIRDLFPSVVMIEQLKLQKQAAQAAAATRKIERLGDYRIVREIGRGGMGIVYEAEQESLGRHVALKVLPERSLLAPKQLQRFQREAQAAARLHHTNIVPVFGFGEQEGVHYYVMQYIAGRGLDEILVELARLRSSKAFEHSREDRDDPGQHGPANGVSVSELARTLLANDTPATVAFSRSGSGADTPPLGTHHADTDPFGPSPSAEPAGSSLPQRKPQPVSSESSPLTGLYWRSVASLGVQVARALQYAHAQGTLHRDIKPANLIMDRQGTVWIADFGLAKVADVDDLTHTGDVLGTLRYMAPERFSGQSDARSDIYSLGLTLYELLTWRPAFNALDRSRLIHQVTQDEPPRPRSVDPRIPRDLETIVLKAISREPAHRYSSAGEFADDLERFLKDRPIHARRITPAERLWRWCRRNRTVAALTAAAFAFLLLAAGVGTVGYVQTRDALHGESQERARAETNLTLALQAFDDIFDKLTLAGLPDSVEETEDADEPDETYHPVVTEKDAALLESLLSFYDRFAEQNAANSNLHRETAKAHRSLGDIQQRLGQFQNAETSYRRAIGIYETLADRSGEQDACACRTEIAAAYNELGAVLAMSRRHSEAREAHRRALAALTSSTQARHASARSRYELARTHLALGALLWDRDQMSRRMQHHEQALNLLDDLVRREPNNPEYRLAQARTYRHRWWAFSRTRQPDHALTNMNQTLELLEQLVVEFPKDPEYRFELSKTYAMRAPRLYSKERGEAPPDLPQRLVEAETQLRRAIAEAETLIIDYPTVPQYRDAIADMYQRLGFVLRQSERFGEAEAELRRAVDLQDELVQHFPTSQSYHYRRAITRSLLIGTLVQTDQLTEAHELLEQSTSDLAAYFAANPPRRFGKRVLAEQYEDLAEVLLKQGKPAAAADAQRQADSLRERPEQRRQEAPL
jgi:serine/threonine protein kinase/Tfp pilus assembly protein PilF